MTRQHRVVLIVVWVAILVAIASGMYRSLVDEGLKDFGSFVASGRAAADGLNPYYSGYPLVYRPYVTDLGREVVSPNLNPPLSVLFFEILAHSDPLVAFRVWYVTSLVLYILAIVILARAYPEQATPLRIAWALSLTGFWNTLELGQIYMPLLVAVTGALLLLQRGRPVLAGILMGLMVALKPNFAVWPVLLLLAGYWRAALASLGTAGLLSLIPLLRYPPSIYVEWLVASSSYTGRVISINCSLPGLAERLGVPWVGFMLAGIMLLILAIWAWHSRPPVLELSGLALLASLLASPIAWTGYIILLLPFLFQRTWSRPELVAAFMLAVPYATDRLFPWMPNNVTNLGWYIWALILLFIVLSRESLFKPTLIPVRVFERQKVSL